MGIVVLGAGVGGLAATLALARAGHAVTLVERDGDIDDGPWMTEPDVARPGCPQLNQSHNFLSRALQILERAAPDLVARLLAAGAAPTDMNILLPPEHRTDALRALCIRRPLVDAVLGTAVRDERNVRVLRARATGLLAGGSRDGIPVVTGVRLADDDVLDADLVMDATGRRSPLPSWLDEIGAAPIDERREACGVLYYTRYYRIADGVPEPPRFAPLAIRADTGYLAYSVLWEEGNVYAMLLATPTNDEPLRAVKDDDAFHAACLALPGMSTFADPSFGEPISSVAAMGGLNNTLRTFVRDGRPSAYGVLPIADSVCHTDPQQAYGMSMALDHAFRLPTLLAEHDDASLAVAFSAAILDEAADRYRSCVAFARERTEIWAGRAPDIEKDLEYALFTGMWATGQSDPGMLVRLTRRAMALDLPRELEDDPDALERTRRAIRGSGIIERAQRGPSRDELLAAMDVA